MIRCAALIIFLLQIINADAKRTCLTDCAITVSPGRPFVVPDGRCKKTLGDYCRIVVEFDYETALYTVALGDFSARLYTRSFYVQVPRYLKYDTSYACSGSDSCAIEFAQKEVLTIPHQTVDFATLSKELVPILLQPQPEAAASDLYCYDNDACPNGTCRIDYDTMSYSQTIRKCQKPDRYVSVTAFDDDSGASFTVTCNRTKCNSPETMKKVTAMFARYNLTDANGRITPIRINAAHGVVASIFLVFGVVVLPRFTDVFCF